MLTSSMLYRRKPDPHLVHTGVYGDKVPEAYSGHNVMCNSSNRLISHLCYSLVSWGISTDGCMEDRVSKEDGGSWTFGGCILSSLQSH